MLNNQAVYIVAAKRTAIGNFLGGLATTPAHLLGAEVIKAVLAETKVAPADCSEVILGQVLTGGAGQNPARQALIAAGLPKEVPAWLVNQVCGSGLKAVMLGVQSILCGQSEIVIAGGQENMSLSAHSINMRTGTKMGDATLKDMMIFDGLWDAFNNCHMGITAENVAEQYKITREMQDEFSVKSQNKAEKAQKEGKFKEEIAPITVKDKKKEVIIDQDEFPRHGATMEGMNALRAAFKSDGTVTAGNASGINDGAAVVMLMNETAMKKYNLKPLAKIVSFAQAGVDPKIMGTGPIPATRKALEKAGWKVEDLDLIEANEAFAAQAISVNKELKFDESKVNVNGGAVALGHPIGASGARVLVTLLHELKRRDLKKGLATLCVGGGMGVAMCIERS